MLKKLLNKIKIILIIIYLIVPMMIYFIVGHFHTEEKKIQIQKSLLMIESMKKYIDEYQKQVIYKLIDDKKLSADFFDPYLMSSTFIVSKVNEMLNNKNLKEKINIKDRVEFKIASDNPVNPNNKANKFESEVLNKFNTSNMTSYSQVIERNGIKTLFYALPGRINSEACLKCHGDPKEAPVNMIKIYGDKNGFNENIGHIRSINVIYSTLDANKTVFKFYLAIAVIALFVFMGIYFIIRYFLIQLTQKDKFIAKQSKFAAMGEMIGMIAHQWRQPLTGMSITTNNLLLDIELQDIDEKRFKDSLEVVNKQILYLSETIDDFKNFFKPSIGFEEIYVAKLIKDSCMIIDSSIRSKGIEIIFDIDEKLKIVTKKNDVTQIVLNLIKNSMDAYEENKIENREIKISAVDSLKRVEIFVKDNAGGIPEDIVDKIFDPYFSTKDKKNGTGLGLYMSKMIAEDHLSGYLDVSVKDSSTTFKIVLIKKEM